MDADYGARILAGGLLAAPTNAAYGFGVADFSVTVLFETTQPGTLASCKANHGQDGGAGWLVVLQPSGHIKFVTDNGWGYYQVVSGPTAALDGSWHSVAAVRQNGQLLIYFDSQPLAAQSSGSSPTPVNVSNSQRLVIGGTDQQAEPYRQFTGILEDVTLWNRGLAASEIWRTMFNKVTPQDPGLVGLWEMDQSFADRSPTNNDAVPSGAVGFAPVMHCLWALAPNAYSYLAIDMHSDSDFAAQIGPAGLIAIPPLPSYQFGTGDFAVTCIFASTTGGALVSSKSAGGGSGADAGWLLILNADGSLTFATDNGFGYYLINSAPAGALDAAAHAVAAVRSGGTLSLWLDGMQLPVTVLSSQPPPLNVSSNLRLVIGQTDQPAARQFLGVIEDVTLWNRAITASEIRAARFNALNPATPGLVGYWAMDQDLTDSTTAQNSGASSGAVSFIDMTSDFGAQVAAGGLIAIPANPAYQFGTGDFSVTCLFSSTTGGALVTSKSPSGGSGSYAGWLLILNGDGSLTFVTDNGWGYYLINSVATSALDGRWHSVAAVRSVGGLSIWFDGALLQASVLSSQQPPLNVSSNLRVVIGQADQPPARQFVGVIEDVTLWNRAITAAEIQAVRFNALNPATSGLVGFWKMDRDLSDASPIRNTGAVNGPVTFIPVAHQAQRIQTLAVTAGTAYLYGAVLDKSQQTPVFPANTSVTVARPDGVLLNQQVSTDDLVVQLNGTSVWVFCVKAPMAGNWTFTIQAPAGAPVLVSVQTTPTANIPTTIGNALTPLYADGGGHFTARRARGLTASDEILSDWSWADIGAAVGVTLTTVAAVVGGTALALGAAISAPVVVGCAAVIGVGAVIANVGMALQVEQSSFQVATAIGLPGPTFGGTAQGNVTLMLDGQAYFAALRDLLLAVQYGHYAPAGITLPAKPNLKTMLTAIGAAGKKVSFLLWDVNSAQHLWDNNYWLSTILRTYMKGGYNPNTATRDAFNGVANVDVRLETYAVYQSQRWLNSQHQKIAIVRVGGIKLALAGGLNALTGYWDFPSHPFTKTDAATRKPWHDAAVLVQGPAVDLIEAEFDRRWSKTGGAPSGTGDYAKIAFWEAQDFACLDQSSVCAGGASASPYQNRNTGGGQYPVDVLITNSEFAQRVTQVRDKLINSIGAATNWAYLENFIFHDILVVKAVIAKLANTPAFNVVIMTPYPTKVTAGLNAAGFALTRAALAALMLSGAEWSQITYAAASGTVTLNRTDCSGTPFVTLPDGSPVELGTFTYVLASDGSTHIVNLLKISSIVQTAAARVIATSPCRYITGIAPNPSKELPGLAPQFRAVYVHSKMAIFDTAYAITGSANFNARSMANDGECSIGTSSSTAVTAMRNMALGHWGVDPTTQNWKTVMAAFVNNPTDRLGVVPLPISALWGSQPTGWDYNMLSTLVDPSFFL